jgi:prefoldin subunit 5
MDIDPTKAPRTHAAWKKAYDAQELAKLMVELSVQLEVELNVATANEAIAENKVHILEKELEKTNNRIKRLEDYVETLEECGDSLFNSLTRDEAMKRWKRAKEAKL